MKSDKKQINTSEDACIEIKIDKTETRGCCFG